MLAGMYVAGLLGVNFMRVVKIGIGVVTGFTVNHRLVGHQLVIVAPHSVLSDIAGS